MPNVDNTFIVANKAEALVKKLGNVIEEEGDSASIAFFATAILYLKTYPHYVSELLEAGEKVPGSPIDFLYHIKDSMD